jgi:competence protein ComEC
MTVAVRGPDGRLGFVGKPHDKYAASAWLQRDGDRRDPLSAPAQDVRCDGFGCVLHRKGRIVAISARFAALAEDCMRADIVVAAFDVPDCVGPIRVIGRKSALHDGGYAIDFAPLRIESVTQARGLRPWSHPPQDISAVNNGG